MDIELTKAQENALKIAVTRYINNEPYTCIAGYAGTGKTTLIGSIVEAFGVYPHEVCYIAYTGKAAKVLSDKGYKNSMTAHRLLYQSFRKPDGSFYHKPRLTLEYPYKIIVVDEVSMIPRDMWNLLLSHHHHVLAFGDPEQLPPVGEGQDNEVLKNPHIFLDEVVRQAQDNEIIKLSMDIRAGKILLPYKGSQVQIIDKDEVIDGMYDWADQIICAKNETRRNINNYMRERIYGTTDTFPLENDKVICLRNYWEEPNEAGEVLVNGTTGTISYIRCEDDPVFNKKLLFDFLPDGYDPTSCEEDPYFNNLFIDYKLLTEGEPTVNKLNFKKFMRYKDNLPKEFDYAYCITCWKAQGSEYNKVLVFEENFPFEEVEHRRYLYTAVTRAKEKLVLVRK